MDIRSEVAKMTPDSDDGAQERIESIERVASVEGSKTLQRRNLIAAHRVDDNFAVWFFKRVFFPASPILITWLIEYVFRFGTVVLADEKTLIFAFLFPVIYLQEANSQTVRNLLYIVSCICLVLFVCAIIAKHSPPTINQSEALQRLYSAGLVAATVEVIFATLAEIVRRAWGGNKCRSDTLGGGFNE